MGDETGEWMRGQDELIERQEDERSGESVRMMRQVTLRVRGQGGPTKREEDERSEGNVGMTM
jgi:hypothetical protein